jgi:hypothetical protein
VKSFFAVFTQFLSPCSAYRYVTGKNQNLALAGTIVTILLIGTAPFVIMGDFVSSDLLFPVQILVERVILASAAGLAVYILAFATGGRRPLWPAISTSFLSMGAFLVIAAVLALINYLFNLPQGFSWSPAEIMFNFSVTRLSVFTVLFFSRMDVASLATVYLWGRGLSIGWNESTSFGQRMAWAVYLFGVLLLTLPVFIAPQGAEGGS